MARRQLISKKKKKTTPEKTSQRHKTSTKSSTKTSTKASAKAKTSTQKTPSTDDARFLQKIREEIWPVERQVLFNPERLRYVRKLIKPEGCVFCRALEQGVGAESLLLHAGSHAMVVLNKFPYNTGHVLVLPRRHCGEFLELTAEEHAEINTCLQRAIHALTEIYAPSGFNVGLNLGSAAGAGIPEHLHYHVVPRWAGDANFFALIAETKVVVETLEQSYARLLPYFEGHRG